MIKKVNNFLSFKEQDIKLVEDYKNIEEFLITINKFEKNISNNGLSKIKRNIVYFILDKMPKYQQYDKYRDPYYLDRHLYVYNKNANNFKTFHMGNFNSNQNDKHELKWFEKYCQQMQIKNIYIDNLSKEASLLRENFSMLIKCSTTTLYNQEYMVANYCMKEIDYSSKDSNYSQNFAIYETKKINKKFMSLLSSNMKPFHGFVRYDSSGKGLAINTINNFLSIISGKSPLYDAIKFSFLILSYFVKSEKMWEEGEYRHLLITNYKFIQSLELEAQVMWEKTEIPEKDLNKKKNEFYKECWAFNSNNVNDNEE